MCKELHHFKQITKECKNYVVCMISPVVKVKWLYQAHSPLMHFTGTTFLRKHLKETGNMTIFVLLCKIIFIYALNRIINYVCLTVRIYHCCLCILLCTINIFKLYIHAYAHHLHVNI